MAACVHLDMHRDHIIWSAEVGQWLDDIEIWKNDLNEAVGQLKDIEKSLDAHRDALSAHASAIQARERASHAHEQAIAAYESGDTGEELPAMAVAHQKESQSQACQRSAHERVRRHHHALMANWSLLRKALDQQM